MSRLSCKACSSGASRRMSTAPASSGNPRSSGKSFSTVSIAFLSKNSAALTSPCCFMAVTASQADCVVGNNSKAEAEAGMMGAVRIVTDERNASVPSEPTSRWAMMANGSSNSTMGRIFRPVTFLMLYLRRMRSAKGLLLNTRSCICCKACRNAGCVRANSSRLAASPVSSKVPSARMSRADSSMR